MSAGRRTAHWARVAAAYGGLTAVVTWPLATALPAAIAGDLGDPLFVAWVMARVDDHLIRFARGVPGAWDAMWQAPIFAPAPDALTFSEHFIGQALQALPVAWLSGNAVLGYNLVYVATLVLTGVFTYGLARRLTGHPVAAAISGGLASFNDYRLAWSISHLHTLSIHWWVAALWGIDVWAETGRLRALAAATAALAMLHLSSNYLMAYCAPLTIGFSVWALARHGRLRDVGRWAGLAVAGVAAAGAMLPILLRYLATQSALGAGTTAEVAAANSATFAAFAREGRWLVPFVLLAVVGVFVPATGTTLTRRARAALLVLAAAAFLLAMGPVVRMGDTVFTGPYEWLRSGIPGYAGLRVPHRFVAPGTTLLALLAGAGAAALGRWQSGRLVGALGVGLVVGTALTRPFPLAVPLDASPLRTPSAPPTSPAAAPVIYRHVRTLPGDALIVEFPFGSVPYEIRYTVLTRSHGRRLLNGYSGLLPDAYLRARDALRDPLADPDRAWRALAEVTHAIVHTTAWPDTTGDDIRHWLESAGGRPLASADGDWLYDLRDAHRPGRGGAAASANAAGGQWPRSADVQWGLP